MKNILGFFKKAGKAFAAFVLERSFSSALLFALSLTFTIYCLHMRSLVGAFVSMAKSPLHTILNFLILLLFYCIPLFFKRRIFGTTVVTVLWLTLGITDCVLMGIRPNRPFMASDLMIFEISIIEQYLNIFELILCIAALLLAVAIMVVAFFKMPKTKPQYLQSLRNAGVSALAALMLFAGLGALKAVDPANMKNRRNSYEAYGFPYCFLWSVFDHGIDRPEDYSEKSVEVLLEKLAAEPAVSPEKTPNIVFVQLESLFDVERYTDIELSADPLPNLRALKEHSLSGLLTVPSIGAGTANTEFEVLTGLPTELFGAGEYPYETILAETTCESIAYNLNTFGYATHAIHNHTATFYDRHLVYANLGFDVYTGAEFIPNIEENERGWEKDKILTSTILDSLNSTPEQDFVFAVSVQAHGRYPQVPIEGVENAIKVTGNLEEEALNAFEYYVNQLYEVDAFVGELIAALSEYPEEVILVLYGDHLPSLDIEESHLSEGSLFSTDYWMWSNRGLAVDGTRLDISTYELSSMVCGSLGMEDGIISRIYRAYRGNNVLLMEALRLAGYDMLYGDRLASDGKNPYKPSDMRLGMYDIRISAIEVMEENYIIKGSYFTPASNIYVNGKKATTAYISDSVLILSGRTLKSGDKVTVVQISSDLQKLSESEAFEIE